MMHGAQDNEDGFDEQAGDEVVSEVDIDTSDWIDLASEGDDVDDSEVEQ